MALADNLVAYYKLDESSGNLTDEVGGFTLTNNGTTGFASALINNGADYGTANSTKYFRGTSNLGIDGGAMTISTWIKMRTEIASSIQAIALLGSVTSQVNYAIAYEYNAGTRRIRFNRQKQSVANQTTQGNATLGTASWHHVVMTYDGTNIAGWLDNTQIGANVAASGNGSAAAISQFMIGYEDQWQGGFLSAYQDETGVWSRAITSAEISELYNSGSGRDYTYITGGGGGTVLPQFKGFARL